MEWLWIIVVTFLAGMGAGLGTGFAGMSAAAVISPMLITFLGMDSYMAVGIALSSDVLASAVSAYGKRACVYGGRQLCGESDSAGDNGRVFRVYDLSSGN